MQRFYGFVKILKAARIILMMIAQMLVKHAPVGGAMHFSD